MNSFDYIILAIIISSTLFGLFRGVVKEILGLLAWFVGIYLAVNYGEFVGFQLGIENLLTRSIIGGIVAFVLVLIVVAFIKMAFSSIIDSLELNTSDKILGGIFGMIRGIIICSALVIISSDFTSLPETQWWKDAYLSSIMEKIVDNLFILEIPEENVKACLDAEEVQDCLNI